jgi:hypothetical protein
MLIYVKIAQFKLGSVMLDKFEKAVDHIAKTDLDVNSRMSSDRR